MVGLVAIVDPDDARLQTQARALGVAASRDLDVMRWLGRPVTRVHAEASGRLLARFGVADTLATGAPVDLV